MNFTNIWRNFLVFLEPSKTSKKPKQYQLGTGTKVPVPTTPLSIALQGSFYEFHYSSKFIHALRNAPHIKTLAYVIPKLMFIFALV